MGFCLYCEMKQSSLNTYNLHVLNDKIYPGYTPSYFIGYPSSIKYLYKLRFSKNFSSL